MTIQNIILCEDTIKIVITPKLEKLCGRSGAVALQQLHFCLSSNEKNGKAYENQRWIYNTYDEWHEHFIPQYSSATIQRAFTKLEKMNVVKSCQLEKKYGNRRKSYTINYDVLDALITEYDKKNPPTDKLTSSCLIKKNTNNTQPKTTPISFAPSHNNSSISKTNNEQSISPINENQQSSDLPSQMIYIWNEHIGKDLSNVITLYPKLTHQLPLVLKDFFNNDLNAWLNYCLKIASSKYLMGEVNNFRIRFSYVIDSNGIQEILYGDKFTFGDRVTPNSNEALSPKKAEELPFSTYKETEESQILREKIKKQMEFAVYESWLKPTFIAYNKQKDNYILFTKSRFMKDRIETHYGNIAELFTEIHVFTGTFPEEHMYQMEFKEVTQAIMSKENDEKTTLNGKVSFKKESDFFLTNTPYSHTSGTHITTHECLIQKTILPIVEKDEENNHSKTEGEGRGSFLLQEKDGALVLRQKLKENFNQDLYEYYLKETFILIDDGYKSILFIKHESQKEHILNLLNNTEIVFSEISVHDETFFRYYFCESIQTISDSQNDVEKEPIKETSHYFLHSSKPLNHPNQLSFAVSENAPIAKCYDHHHKMRLWSHQNDVFLTNTTSNTTSNIFLKHANTKHPLKKQIIINLIV